MGQIETRGRLARTWLRESSGSSGGRLGISKIGNDLQNLPDALKGNLYTVLRSLFDDDDGTSLFFVRGGARLSLIPLIISMASIELLLMTASNNIVVVYATFFLLRLLCSG